MPASVDDEPSAIARDARLEAMLRRRLTLFDARSLAADGAHRAAVAFAVVDEGHGAELGGLPTHASWRTNAAVLLTRRAATLRAHAGQWALPGGRVDAGEAPEAAALRGLAEEVGLVVDSAAILVLYQFREVCLRGLATRVAHFEQPLFAWR